MNQSVIAKHEKRIVDIETDLWRIINIIDEGAIGHLCNHSAKTSYDAARCSLMLAQGLPVLSPERLPALLRAARMITSGATWSLSAAEGEARMYDAEFLVSSTANLLTVSLPNRLAEGVPRDWTSLDKISFKIHDPNSPRGYEMLTFENGAYFGFGRVNGAGAVQIYFYLLALRTVTEIYEADIAIAIPTQA